MTDYELLQAMSDMLDTKLNAQLQPIKEDMRGLKEDVQVLKDDMHILKEDVHILKEEVQVLKEDVHILKEDVQVLKEDVQVLKDDVQFAKTDLRRVKLYQENILEPRLNTIEACYTSTFNRYKSDVERIEMAFDDIDTLKQVVARHSEQLRKLA